MREFVQRAFGELGARVEFEGAGVDEVGRVTAVDLAAFTSACENRGGNSSVEATGFTPGDVVVKVDSRYYRTTEVESLLGDPSKALERLGWRPRATFSELVHEMVREDLQHALRTDVLLKEGFVVREPRE